MPKKNAEEQIVATRPPLTSEAEMAPSILKEGAPTRKPMPSGLEVAPSILKEGAPTRKRLPV